MAGALRLWGLGAVGPDRVKVWVANVAQVSAGLGGEVAERLDEDALDLGGAEFPKRVVDAHVVDGQERVGDDAHVPVRVVAENLGSASEALDKGEPFVFSLDDVGQKVVEGRGDELLCGVVGCWGAVVSLDGGGPPFLRSYCVTDLLNY